MEEPHLHIICPNCNCDKFEIILFAEGAEFTCSNCEEAIDLLFSIYCPMNIYSDL